MSEVRLRVERGTVGVIFEMALVYNIYHRYLKQSREEMVNRATFSTILTIFFFILLQNLNDDFIRRSLWYFI